MNGKPQFSRKFNINIIFIFFATQFLVILFLVFASFGWQFHALIGTLYFLILFFLFLGEIFLFVITHKYFLQVSNQTNLFAELGVEVTQAILMDEDIQTVFLTVLDYVIQIIGNAKSGSIQAITKDGKVKIVASRGFDEKYCKAFSIPLEYAFWYRQSNGKTKEPLIIKPEIILKAWLLDNLKKQKIKSVISAPLYIEGNLYGFINVDSYKRNNFKNHDLKIISKIKAQIEVSLLARTRYNQSIAESRADCLSGFHSRTHFSILAGHALAQAKRYGYRLVLAMLDIDDLKTINDTYGHQNGDLVIITIADAIRKETRTSDIVGRYGGDEFIALFTETDAKSMNTCLERTLVRLKKAPLYIESKEVVVSFSFGFANYPEDGLGLDELIKIADTNLYAMKTEKKNAKTNT